MNAQPISDREEGFLLMAAAQAAGIGQCGSPELVYRAGALINRCRDQLQAQPQRFKDSLAAISTCKLTPYGCQESAYKMAINLLLAEGFNKEQVSRLTDGQLTNPELLEHTSGMLDCVGASIAAHAIMLELNKLLVAFDEEG